MFPISVTGRFRVASFRGLIVALAVLALFAGSVSAQVYMPGAVPGPFQCTAQVAGATPTLRAEGLAELVGDIVVACTGGTTPVVGSQIPTADITVSFGTGTNVTSRLLTYSPLNPLTSANTSEALLLIDEPGSGWMVALPGAVGFGPDAPQTLCGAGGTPYSAVGAGGAGCVESVQQATEGDYVMSGPNVFAGVASANQVTFHGIPILPPGAADTGRVFRITNIRLNATTLPPLTQVFASISSSGSVLPALPLLQPVGWVQSGLIFQVRTPDSSAVLTTPDFSGCMANTLCPYGILQFSENFGSAFKTRVVPLSSTVGAGQAMNLTGQNIPGWIFSAESGFISSSITGTQTGAVAGLADFGTRLKAEFSNIPTGVRIYVATGNIANLVGTPPGDSTTSFGQLVTSEATIDGDGSIPSVPAAGSITWNGSPKLYNYAPLAMGSGPVTAVWEVVNTAPRLMENYNFPVWIVFDPGVTPTALNIAARLAANPPSGATPQSVIDDVYRLRASGAITINPNSLLAKLDNAMADRNRGKCGPAGNVYGAFSNEVMAHTGKGITPAAAAVLIADAQYLQAHCP